VRKGRTAVKGTVQVEKDSEGNPVGVSILTDQGGIVDVALDATGQKLAEEMAGQKVRALGTFRYTDPERLEFQANRFRGL